jgi:hypothetical protein
MTPAVNAEATNGINSTKGPSWNPLRCTDTGLPTNLTVMVKVLAIALLLTNHVRLLPDPWLSFVPWIDLIPGLAFQLTIQTVFVISTLAIVFNRNTRIFSIVLGSTMLLAVVSSKAYYGNNKTFCGLMLLLAGLYKRGGPPFIRWQLALTYFGAGLNKLLDHDWQTGIFFEYWSVERLHEHAYIAIDSLLPRLWLGRLMCWFTIVTELGVVPFLLLPRLYYWGVLANILFQSGLLLFVGNTFTMFFYAMSAASFAFVDWPDQRMRVIYHRSGFLSVVRKVMTWIDVDRRYLWIPSTTATDLAVRRNSSISLEVVTDSRTYTGCRALRMILLYNPVTYIAIVVALACAGYGEGAYLYRRILIGSALAILMPPLAWCVDYLLERSR